MNAQQLANIPSGLLYGRDVRQLEEWLHERGLRMSLLELDQERRRRGAEAGR